MLNRLPNLFIKSAGPSGCISSRSSSHRASFSLTSAEEIYSTLSRLPLPLIRTELSNLLYGLTYCRDILGIRPENLNVADLTAERIAEFLNWLERKCNNSISTRNQRLAAIHSLFRYIQMQAPEHMFQCQQVLGIPYKKTSRRQVGYLSEAETKKHCCPCQIPKHVKDAAIRHCSLSYTIAVPVCRNLQIYASETFVWNSLPRSN